MPLTTRCNRCGNQFPVYAQQLRARRGRVECPRCGDSVDALAGLQDEPGAAGDAGSPGGRAVARPRRTPEPRTTRGGTAPMVPGAAPVPGRVRSALAVTALGRGSAGGGPGRGLWGGLVLALTLTLVGQVLWWWRSEVLRDPRGFAALSALCDLLGCEVPLPRLPGALAVREPSLVPDDADDADGGVLTLRLRIINTAALPQAAPQLELELFDGQGERRAARRFTPEEYGAPAALAPGETRDLTLALSPPREEVAGFKVRLW